MVPEQNRPIDERPPTPVSLSRRHFVSGAFGVGLAAVAGSALTGCGSDDDPSRDRPVDDPAAVEGGPKTTERTDVSYPDGYVGPRAATRGPILAKGKQVTLRVAVIADAGVGDWSENEFSAWYAEQTGVRVEYQTIPLEEAMTKVNAMIASGDIPDVFLHVDFTAAQLALYGQQGLILPLNDLIDQYGVEVKRVFEQYPDAKVTVTSTDGNIYSLPNVNDCYHCNAWNNRVWIYQPWLDELGLPVPSTPADLEAVLEAFKSRDPNGNGQADEIPFMGYNDAADAGAALDTYFMSAYLYNPGEPWLVVENGKVDIVVDKAGWREGLRYLNRLYSKGLIAKETFTQSMEQLIRTGTHKDAPVLGASKGGTWFVFTTMDETTEAGQRWKDYVALPPLQGPDGTRFASWDYYQAVTPGHFVITKACQNPGVALMWGDGQYELETILRAYYGPLDENWRWAKPDETAINGKQALYSSLERADGKTEGLGWNQYGISYRSSDFRLAERVDPENPTFEKPLYEQTARAYFPYRQPKQRQLPPLYMTEDQAALTSELATTLSNHVKTSLTKFALGELDPNDDADWQAYVDTIEQMGRTQYLEAYQKAYDDKYG